MEIPIGNSHRVVMTTHRTYHDLDPSNSLKAVSEFEPFKEYVAGCADCAALLKAFIIRNIKRIAHRVVSVTIDVEILDKDKSIMQTVTLKNEKGIIILPIASVNNKYYALLQYQRRIPLGNISCKEAFVGYEEAGGKFVIENEEELTKIGYNLSSIEMLSEKPINVGNEGALPYKIGTIATELTEAALQQLMSPQSSSLITAVPLTKIFLTVDDAKANAVTALLSAKKPHLFANQE